MNSKRLYFILLGCIGLLTAALIGGTYGINQALTTKANALIKLKAQSAALDQEQLSLNKAKKDIAKYSDLEKITKAIVPEDKDQAQSTLEIVKIADQNDVYLSGITFPASTLGTSPSGAVTPTTTTSSPAASSAQNKKAALSQLTPVKSIPGVYALQITVSSDTTRPVAYSKFINFLSDLEHNRRTAQVNAISITPDKANPSLLSFTLGLNEYIKP